MDPNTDSAIISIVAAVGALIISGQFMIWYRIGRVEVRQEEHGKALRDHVGLHTHHGNPFTSQDGASNG